MAFKPNRDLLNVNFEGYKLSPSPIACVSCTVEGGVHRATMKDGDFSYQHMRAYSLHNHLFPDPHDQSTVYWISADGSVQRGAYEDGAVRVSTVYSCSGAPDSSSNPSLVMLTQQLVLHTAGRVLSVLHTDKSRNKWVLVKSYTLSDHFPVNIATAVSLQHTIQLLTTELHTSSTFGKEKTNIAKCTWYELKFNSPIESIQDSAETLCASISDIGEVMSFQSKSLPLYAAFQAHPSQITHHLLLMSETSPTLPAHITPPTDPKSEATQENTVSLDSGCHFGLGYDSAENHEWSQTDTEVVVTFPLPRGVTKREIYCVISRTELVVGLIDGTTFQRGELYAAIDTEGSTWTIDGNILEVTLEKCDSGVHWPHLQQDENRAASGQNQGTAPAPPDTKRPCPLEPERPHPLVSEELEECDNSEEDATLYLISQESTIVSKASLCGRQLVFTAPSLLGHTHYFSTRHDVDALVWLPSSVSSSPPWTHVNTFNALGYVQASKSDRKFTTAPPDLSYCIITDCTRHVFVYAQPEGGVKGNKATEFLYTLGNSSDILGVTASNNGLVFLLTPQTLYGLVLPSL